METVKLSTLLILIVILLIPSLSLSAGHNQSPEPSLFTVPYIPVVAYTGSVAGSPDGESRASAGAISGAGEGAYDTSRNMKIFRVEGLGMASNRNNTLLRDDTASFAVKAPMPKVNGALSLVGTLYQTTLDSGVTKWIQVMSLLASRKVNAEFAYSAKVDRNSSFDSVISCALHPGNDSGAADVRADFRYTIRF